MKIEKFIILFSLIILNPLFGQDCLNFNNCNDCFNADCFWQPDAPEGYQCNDDCYIMDTDCYGTAPNWTAECPAPNASPGGDCHINGVPGIYSCLNDCLDADWVDELLENGVCDDHPWIAPLNCPEFGYDCGDCNPDWDGTDPLGFCGGNSEIGSECISENGTPGYYDCVLNCQDSDFYDWWLGDGYCDMGYDWVGLYFSCLELGYDCGDCNPDWDGIDPSGLCVVECSEPGDMNLDEMVNVLDVVQMVLCIMGNETDVNCDCGDFNEDNQVDVVDIIGVVNLILTMPELPPECLLEPDIGPCDGSCPRYFFNPDSGECEVFFWGCCEGVVPFETLEECEEACE